MIKKMGFLLRDVEVDIESSIRNCVDSNQIIKIYINYRCLSPTTLDDKSRNML